MKKYIKQVLDENLDWIYDNSVDKIISNFRNLKKTHNDYKDLKVETDLYGTISLVGYILETDKQYEERLKLENKNKSIKEKNIMEKIKKLESELKSLRNG